MPPFTLPSLASVEQLSDCVLLAARSLGFRKAKEATDTLGRVRVCLETMRELGSKFPPVIGRTLLVVCLAAGDQQGCDMALELMDFMTADSLLSEEIRCLASCLGCQSDDHTKRASLVSGQHFWDRVHCFHEGAKKRGSEGEAGGEGQASSEEREETKLEDCAESDLVGIAPFIYACSKPLYLPLALRMSQALEEEGIPPLMLSVTTSPKDSALLGQWVAALGTPAASEEILGKNVERLTTCLAANLPSFGGTKECLESLWKGKEVCFKLACRFLEGRIELLPAQRDMLVTAMALTVFKAISGVCPLRPSCTVAVVTSLLRIVPTTVKEWIAEVHEITLPLQPFGGGVFSQLCCPMKAIFMAAMSRGLMDVFDALVDAFKEQFANVPAEFLTPVLYQAAVLGGLEAVRVPLQYVSPIILVRKAQGNTIANCLLHGDAASSVVHYWLLGILDDLYRNNYELALAFFEETSYTVLERILPPLLRFDDTTEWLRKLFSGLEAQGRREVVDLEIGHCYAFLIAGERSLLEQFLRPEALQLLTSRAIIAMTQWSAKEFEDLLPVAPAAYCRTDNDDNWTPLASCAHRCDEERIRLVFNACPEAMYVEMPRVGSALHCMISANVLSVEFLLHINDTLEEKDFLSFVDRQGNNALHIAALSRIDRSVIELLRAIMPAALITAANKQGCSPLDLYKNSDLSNNDERGDLSELFLPRLTAKGAF